MAEIQEIEISLSNGVTLPAKCYHPDAPLVVVLGHGLGTNGLKKRSHNHDKWISLSWNTLIERNDVGLIAYTARGHGNSTGWENNAEEFTQFTWENLAEDMINIGSSFHLSKFIAGGQSMGSATAIYAAIKYPERIQALILLRPPTAWHVRHARRGHLNEIALQTKERYPNELNYNVFHGAAVSDLPPIDSNVYSLITCPVLILCHEEDHAHPVSTAITLSKLIPQAQLYISKSPTDALEEFPGILNQFIESLKTQSPVCDEN